MNRIDGLLIITLATLVLVCVMFAVPRRIVRLLNHIRLDNAVTNLELHTRLIKMEKLFMAQWEDVISKIRDQRTVIASLDAMFDKLRMDFRAISTSASAATALRIDEALKELDMNEAALKAAMIENTAAEGELVSGSLGTGLPNTPLPDPGTGASVLGTTPISGSGNNVAGEAATMAGETAGEDTEGRIL